MKSWNGTKMPLNDIKSEKTLVVWRIIRTFAQNLKTK